MKNRKSTTASVLLALVASNCFLYFFFREVTAFHFIPYSIHDAFFTSVISSSAFIDIFDLFASSIIFLSTLFVLTVILTGPSHTARDKAKTDN